MPGTRERCSGQTARLLRAHRHHRVAGVECVHPRSMLAFGALLAALPKTWKEVRLRNRFAPLLWKHACL